MAAIPPRQGRITGSSIDSLESNVAELLAEDMRDLEMQDAAERIRKQPKTTSNTESKAPTDSTRLESSKSDLTSSQTSKLSSIEASSTSASGYRSWKDRMQTNDSATRDYSATRDNTAGEGTGRTSWRDRLNYGEIEKDVSRSSLSRTRRESLEDNTDRASVRVSLGESTSDRPYRPWRERLSRHESIDDTPSRSWRTSAFTPSTSGVTSTSSTGSAGTSSWRDRLRRYDSTDDRTSTSSWRDSHDDTRDTSSYRRASEATLYGGTDTGSGQYSSNRLGLGSKYSARSDCDRGISSLHRYGSDSTRGDRPSDTSTGYRSRYNSDVSPLERQNVDVNVNVLRSRNDREYQDETSSAEADTREASGVSTESTNNDSVELVDPQSGGNDNNDSNEASVEAEQDGRNMEMENDNEERRNEGENDMAAADPEPNENEAVHVGDQEEEKEAKTWSTQDVLKLLVKAINYRSPIRDIETILKWGLDVNTPYKNGLCPLHYAAYTNYVNCLDLLLKKGANINITDDIGYTPLHLAARCGHYKTLIMLIENGAMITFNEPGVEIRGIDEMNKLGFTTTEPIHLAIQNLQHECTELLLENGARSDNKYFMGYEISLAHIDDVKGIEILLKHGASPNVFNRCGLSPLMKACKDHHIDTVRLLLRYNADFNAQMPPLFEQKNVLQIAIESGNIVIVNLLLAKNPTLKRHDNYKYSPLHTAINRGRADICRLLLQRKADPDERTDEGATPLMMACSKEAIKDRKDIVKMLIDCGADVNAFGRNFSHFDPYLSPIVEYLKNIGCSESFSIIDLLIKHGARIHYTTGDVLLGGKRDPFAVLQYAHCMANFPEVLDKTIQAAQRFNALGIHACDNLPDDMKNTLLLVATKPKDLKHTVRLMLRQMLMPDLEDDIAELPLPKLIKSYLMFK